MLFDLKPLNGMIHMIILFAVGFFRSEQNIHELCLFGRCKDTNAIPRVMPLWALLGAVLIQPFCGIPASVAALQLDTTANTSHILEVSATTIIQYGKNTLPFALALAFVGSPRETIHCGIGQRVHTPVHHHFHVHTRSCLAYQEHHTPLLCRVHTLKLRWGLGIPPERPSVYGDPPGSRWSAASRFAHTPPRNTRQTNLPGSGRNAPRDIELARIQATTLACTRRCPWRANAYSRTRRTRHTCATRGQMSCGHILEYPICSGDGGGLGISAYRPEHVGSCASWGYPPQRRVLPIHPPWCQL